MIATARNLSTAEWLEAWTIGGVWALLSLLAIWAALSRRHWAVRSAALLVALAALFHVTAYEAVIFFSVQFGLMIAALHILDRKATCEWILPGMRTVSCKSPFRFSMRDMLIFVTLSACWLGIVSVSVRQHLPFEVDAIMTNAVLAASFSVVTAIGLLASWRPTMFTVWMLALAGHGGAFCYSAYQHDWLYTDAWIGMNKAFYLAINGTQYLLVLAGLASSRIAATRMLRLDESNTLQATNRTSQLFRGAVGVVVISMAIPLAWVYFRMVFPPSIPDEAAAVGNDKRFGKLISLGAKLESPISTIAEDDDSDIDAFAKFVQDHQEGLATAHAMLSEGLKHHVSYRPRRPGDVDLAEGATELRTLARAFVSEGVWYETQGRIDQALECYLDDICLGQIYARDTLLVDYLVGAAIEGIGLQSIIEIRHKLDRDQCMDLRRRLDEYRLSLGPVDEAYTRDFIWSMYGTGWFGRLSTILTGFTGEFWVTDVTDLRNRRDATYQMLVLELCIREYFMDHQQLPRTLQDLIPDYLETNRVDPFSDGPFKYRRRSNDEFVLYSVGENLVDDGGVVVGEYEGKVYTIPEQSEFLRANEGGIDSEKGDLFLDRITWFNPTNRLNVPNTNEDGTARP